jgi:hypothetical protein
MSTALVARGAVGAANLVLKKGPQIVATLGVADLAYSAWDYVFGDTPEEEVQSLVNELKQGRALLNDPTTDPSEMQELAERDAELQEELAELGYSVSQEADGDTVLSSSVAEMSQEMAGSIRYDLDQLDIIKSQMSELANMLEIPYYKTADFIRVLRALMQFSNSELESLERLMGRM